MTTEPIERRSYGDYEVEGRLGRGSVGTVYLARHRRLNRRVALKVMQYEQDFEDAADRLEFEARLQREAELCASLQHPNLVTLYEAGYEGDVISYLATEFVDGETLLARLKRTRPIPLPEALSISADLLRALDYAHGKGIIHRDVKPANIFLTAGGQAKIGDFGVARPVHSTLTVTGSLIGTPNYMSPEQVKTMAVSTRCDLFSAGVVMYEILTGVRPFASPDLSGILYNVVQLVPPPASQVNPEVPAEVADLVARLMAKNPDDRYATAGEALAALERIRGGLPARTAPHSSFDQTTPIPRDLAIETEIDNDPPDVLTSNDLVPEKRRGEIPPWLFWSVTLLLTAALASASWVIIQRTDERPTVQIAPEELRAIEEKRRALAQARGLAGAGRLEEAIRSYDGFLARHPASLVARKERAAAAAALEQMRALEEAAKKKASVSPARTARRRSTSPPPALAEPPPPEPEKPSRWQRFKRWLKGDPAQKPAKPPEG